MINPYRKLDEKDFKKMNIKEGFLVVKAVMPDEMSDLRIQLAESTKDYNNAMVHKIIAMGDNPNTEAKMGDHCMVVGNTLDAVDKGRYCFIDSKDVYCWWTK